MADAPLRVLVVDDSALMRRQLRRIFEEEGGMQVEHARNGAEVMDRIAAFDPNVITLDVNMPEKDGLTCLREVMARAPRPVVMVSSLTREGADATIQSLALGAIDVVLKPDGTVSRSMETVTRELLTKVRAAAAARLRPARLVDRVRAERQATMRRGEHAMPAAGQPAGLTLIGVSTGGPRTLEEILPELPAEYPHAVVVAQHMPANFTASLARRMNTLCAMPVEEVGSPRPLEAGHIYIGRGDADVVIDRRLGRLVVSTVPADTTPWHPSVDRLVRSARGLVSAERLIGVLLTGMGDDGAEEMAGMHRDGGRTIAESEESAAVFGMPGALVARDGASAVLRSERIATRLRQWCGV